MPPNDSGAHFGVLFWHKDGFSTACGNGTIALGYWAVAHHMVQVPENGDVKVVIDVPSGRVVCSILTKNGKPVHGEFINVLSFQIAKDLSVEVPSHTNTVKVDVAFAGAIYATLNASQVGLKIEPKNYMEFIKLGREIKASLGIRDYYRDCREVYCVTFYSEESKNEGGADVITQRIVTIYGDGNIDRSPCGSGTCARLAILLSQG